MTKYRAILIDPEKRSCSEIELAGGLDELYALLQCQHVTTGSRPFNGSMSEGFDTLLVSDDYLEDRDDPRFWFQVDAERNPPSSFPIAGYGLVCGVDEQGGRRDARISIEELGRRITFTQRKFRGFETKPIGLHDIGGVIGAGMQVNVIAPIIDGSEED